MNALRKSLSQRFSLKRKDSIKSKSLSSLMENGQTIMDFKVAVIGAERTGKTQIISQYCYNRYTDVYDPTIEEIHTKHSKFNIHRVIPGIDGERHDIIGNIDILDTSGNLAIDLIEEQLSECDGFMLVFSYDNPMSYDALTDSFGRIIKSRGGKDAPIIIVGNMSDLTLEDKKCEIAEQLGCPFMRVSAAKRLNIDECFECLVCEIIQHTFVIPFGNLATAGEGSRASRRKTTACAEEKK